MSPKHPKLHPKTLCEQTCIVMLIMIITTHLLIKYGHFKFVFFKVKEDKTAKEKLDKVQTALKMENFDIIEKQDKPEKMEKIDHLDKKDEITKKTDSVDKTQKSEQIIKDEKKVEKEEKQDNKAEKKDKVEKVDKPEKTNKEKEEKKDSGEKTDKTAKAEKNVTAAKGPAKSPTTNRSKEATSPDSKTKVSLKNRNCIHMICYCHFDLN